MSENDIAIIETHKRKSNYDWALVDQIRAARNVVNVIQDLKDQNQLDPNNSHHLAIMETDIYKLRRGLCLPSAASTSINIIHNKRIIGDDQGTLTVADIYRSLIPHDSKYPSAEQPNGWWVVSSSGDMYHHAIVAFSRACGIPAYSCTGFSSITEFSPLLEQGGSVAISMNNKFVIEQTLKRFPDSIRYSGDEINIKIESANGTEFRRFQDGRHVITLLEISDGVATFADSFNLPQTYTHGLTVEIPIEDANKYLKYHDGANTRAIMFTKPGSSLPGNHPAVNNCVIPVEVQTDLSHNITPRVIKKLSEPQN